MLIICFFGLPANAITNIYIFVPGQSTVVQTGGFVARQYLGYDRVWAFNCFWDTQTTGQLTSAGGAGRTTAEMQIARTFLDAGWDFVDETDNGNEDIWWIFEGRDYSRLVWELTEDESVVLAENLPAEQ